MGLKSLASTGNIEIPQQKEILSEWGFMLTKEKTPPPLIQF